MPCRCAELPQDAPAGCGYGNLLTRDAARLPIAPFQGMKIWLPFWFPSRSKAIVIGHNQRKATTHMEGA
jgi:hypothetical protein